MNMMPARVAAKVVRVLDDRVELSPEERDNSELRPQSPPK
jgi:hypothetical protein